MLMRSCMLSLMALIAASTFAFGQAPRVISLQGRLTGPGGVPKPDGPYAITFTLYDGATTVWSESQPAVQVVKGLFSVLLGSVTPLPATLNLGNKAYSVGLKAASDPEMTPRIPVAGAPFALAVPYLRSEATSGSPNLIGGYPDNGVSAGKQGSTIGGGGGTTTPNTVTDDFGTVGGGKGNQAGKNPTDSFDAPNATVAGGTGNTANGLAAAIGGGEGNSATGFWSAIAGGYHNITTNSTSMIPGGAYCVAGGYNSFAAGTSAQATHDGAFVWSDMTGISDGQGNQYALAFNSSAPNECSIRATGGVRLVTAVDTTFGGATQGAPTAWLTLETGGDNGAGKFLDTSTKAFLSTGGQWTNNSDRRAKSDISPINARSILERVATLPVTEWSYRAEGTAVRHIGPMAQDFAAAFKVGQDNVHIGSVDESGVALAAIKGLYDMVKAKDVQIANLEKRLEALEKERSLPIRAHSRRSSPPVPASPSAHCHARSGRLRPSSATAGFRRR